MKVEKTIGWLLITGAMGVLIPYTMLTIIFEYPHILRQDTGIVLTKFHAGGSKLIFTWFAFAILGLPLLIAYIKMGELFQNKTGFIKWITSLAIISGIVQIIGLLRWVFVVPVIASSYVNATDPMIKEIAKANFQIVHHFGGVLLGEHIGQLFTIVWTFMISFAFIKLSLFPKWISYFGMLASVIYFMAQAELFATVIPGFPVWDLAGFIGSTVWLVWLIIIGIVIRKKNFNE